MMCVLKNLHTSTSVSPPCPSCPPWSVPSPGGAVPSLLPPGHLLAWHGVPGPVMQLQVASAQTQQTDHQAGE